MMLLLLIFSSVARAQWQTSNWLHLDGSFTQTESKGDVGLTTVARRATGRGELGLNIARVVAVSGVARYDDGGLNASGTLLSGGSAPAAGSGHAFETQALVHVVRAPFVISGGLGQLETYDVLPGAYRTRVKIDYKPLMVTAFLGPVYLRYEHDVWTKGSAAVSLGDLGGGRSDQSFVLPKSAGQGAEIGVLLPGRFVSTKVFIGAHRWSLEATLPVNDGAETVKLPRTVVTRIEAGVGVAF